MNIILILTAFILVAILAPFGIVFNLIFNWKTRKEYFFSIAVSLDQLGNTTCAVLLNMALTKGAYVKFGSPDETVSSVIGKNQERGTLNRFGRFICNLLNNLDKDHTKKAIELDEEES